jgi:hypothetical protein
MDCAQWVRLQRDYATAKTVFEAVRTRFHERIGTCLKSEFLALTNELVRASDELMLARARRNAHLREHGCMVQDGTVSNRTRDLGSFRHLGAIRVPRPSHTRSPALFAILRPPFTVR